MLWVNGDVLYGVFGEDVPVKIMSMTAVKVSCDNPVWSFVRGGEVKNSIRYGFVRKKYLEWSDIRVAALRDFKDDDDVLIIETPVGDEEGTWILICGSIDE